MLNTEKKRVVKKILPIICFGDFQMTFCTKAMPLYSGIKL